MFTFSKELPCASYSGGCLYISGQVAQSVDLQNHTFNQDNGSQTPMRLVCKLSIGDKYWQGTNWGTTEKTFNVEVTPSSKGYTAIDNTKKVSMAYSGVSGYIIQLPDTPLNGEIKFSMYSPICDDSAVTAVFIKDFKLKFKKWNGCKSVVYAVMVTLALFSLASFLLLLFSYFTAKYRGLWPT